MQVIAELDRSPFSELRGYTATDITPAFGPNLLQMVGNSKLDFKVSTLICSYSQLYKMHDGHFCMCDVKFNANCS